MNAWLADLILYIHFAVMLCVVAPVPIMIMGWIINWTAIRNFWFRMIHLGLIGSVLLFHFTMEYCPLTVWEQYMRDQVGFGQQMDSPIRDCLSFFLYWDCEPWVFTVTYTVFGCLIVFLLYWIPPRNPWKHPVDSEGEGL